ncbi:hypothetical protein ACP70R_016855 [Stipagrostis hirtigluma subsp. patula]
MRIKMPEQDDDREDLQLIDGAATFSELTVFEGVYTQRIHGGCGAAVDISSALLRHAVEARIKVRISRLQAHGMRLSLTCSVSEIPQEILLFDGVVDKPGDLVKSGFVVAVVLDSPLILDFNVRQDGCHDVIRRLRAFPAKAHGVKTEPVSLDVVAAKVQVTWANLGKGASTRDDRRNATTAASRTSTGQHVHATLVAADPPRDSYFCVHVPGLRTAVDGGGGGGFYHSLMMTPLPPRVLCTEGRLALLQVPLSCSPSTTDHFIYRASRRPSLRLVPAIPEALHYGPWGLVPGGGDHFVLAVLRYDRMVDTYRLHVFRSDHGSWTRHTLVLRRRGMDLGFLRVILLGGSELAFVDLYKAMVVVDVLAEKPEPRVIPLPNLLPTNHRNSSRSDEQPTPRSFRDVVVCDDGSIRCVEIERIMRLIEIPDAATAEVLHDSELPVATYMDMPPPRYEYAGWRVITWHRTATSDCWRRGNLVHVNDILANDPGHAALLHEMGRGLTARHLCTGVPSLSLDGGDAVYVTCNAGPRDTKTWMVAVDMRKKTLDEVVPTSLEHRSWELNPHHLSCALSKYLNTD